MDEDVPRIVVQPVDIPSTNSGTARSLSSRETYKKLPVAECPDHIQQLVETKQGFLDFISMVRDSLTREAGPRCLATYQRTGLPRHLRHFFVAFDAEFDHVYIAVLQFFVLGTAYVLNLAPIAMELCNDDSVVGIAKALQVCLLLSACLCYHLFLATQLVTWRQCLRCGIHVDCGCPCSV